MANDERKNPRWIFYLLMILMVAIPLVTLAALAYRQLGGLLADRLIQYAATRMSSEDKQEVYGWLAREVPGLYEPAPDPAVGRLLQPDVAKTSRGAEILSNNAGLRDRRPYGPKADGIFRILCVGDSVVMGAGGKEEDRLGNQIEEILAVLSPDLGGRRIEVLSLGLGSWTALNEATYLTSRLSAYDPDLVLVLLVANDITDTEGVSGLGHPSNDFSPETRDLGSGVLSYRWPSRFGVSQNNHLYTGIGPESRQRWRRAFAAWKRLETLLAQRGTPMILGAWDRRLFRELVKLYADQAGLESPLLFTSALGNRLPHDGHPDREGHRILAVHYLHELAHRGWLPIRREDLPALAGELEVGTETPPNPEWVHYLLKRLAGSRFPEEIAFDELDDDTVRVILGGVYPEESRPLESFPYGSPKSVFLLARRDGATTVEVEIEVPGFPELYPFRVEMFLHGRSAAVLELENAERAGRHLLSGSLPPDVEALGALEVSLRTGSYWSTISDPTMRSYRLIAARQR